MNSNYNNNNNNINNNNNNNNNNNSSNLLQQQDPSSGNINALQQQQQQPQQQEDEATAEAKRKRAGPKRRKVTHGNFEMHCTCTQDLEPKQFLLLDKICRHMRPSFVLLDRFIVPYQMWCLPHLQQSQRTCQLALSRHLRSHKGYLICLVVVVALELFSFLRSHVSPPPISTLSSFLTTCKIEAK
jgi:hypothetical protein